MLHLGAKAQIVLVEMPGRAASVRRPEPDVTSASSTLPASPTTDRLSLKPESATTGFVDGAWWPASRDLAAEVSSLIAALADRAGAVERISYNLDAWDAVPPETEEQAAHRVLATASENGHTEGVDALLATAAY
jgi:hypothetical protein